MTDRQLRFVQAYPASLNQTTAARAAGYKNPEVMGSRLMRDPEVIDAIAAYTKPVCEELQISARDVLQQLLYAVTRDARDFCDAEGRIITDVSKLPARATAVIDGLDQEETVYVGHDGEERRTIKTKLRLSPKLGAIDLAMKHKGLFPKEQHEHEHKVSVSFDQLYGIAGKVPDIIETELAARPIGPPEPFHDATPIAKEEETHVDPNASQYDLKELAGDGEGAEQ